MLKTISTLYITLITIVRMVDLIYVFASGSTNLPTVVMLLSFLLVVCGLYVIIKQVVKKVRLRGMLVYFSIYCAVLVFNMLYIIFAVPVELTLPETIAAGSLLELFIGVVIIYYMGKQIRSHYISVYKDKEIEENFEQDDKTSSI